MDCKAARLQQEIKHNGIPSDQGTDCLEFESPIGGERNLPATSFRPPFDYTSGEGSLA